MVTPSRRDRDDLQRASGRVKQKGDRLSKESIMKIAVFSSQTYDRDFLSAANDNGQHELTFFEHPLNDVAASCAAGHEAVCCFVNDDIGRTTLTRLHELGIRLVLLRCAGFNQVDLNTAAALGIAVLRVPAYSPHAVAEHTLALLLSLNRNIHRAWNRVREVKVTFGCRDCLDLISLEKPLALSERARSVRVSPRSFWALVVAFWHMIQSRHRLSPSAV